MLHETEVRNTNTSDFIEIYWGHTVLHFPGSVTFLPFPLAAKRKQAMSRHHTGKLNTVMNKPGGPGPNRIYNPVKYYITDTTNLRVELF